MTTLRDRVAKAAVSASMVLPTITGVTAAAAPEAVAQTAATTRAASSFTQETAKPKKPKVLPPLTTKLPKKSQFLRADGSEGMRCGRRYCHGGLDWFANGGTRVRSPVDGKIVQIRKSRGNSGQVFGGTVKVRGNDGKVWVFRHVNPARLKVGKRVKAGQIIARVTAWRSGVDHVHIELLKKFNGPYSVSNAIDPLRVLRKAIQDAKRARES